MGKIRKTFRENKFKKPIKIPNLIQVQFDSFKWFLDKGIREVFDDMFPIVSYNNDVDIKFVDYEFEEPKYNEEQAREKNITYEAPLKATLCLRKKSVKNPKKKKKIAQQEVFFGNFPLITKRGTFIINGVERVVVSQLVRSPGLYFTSKGAKIIPERGSWIEIEADKNNVLWVRVDKRRKIPFTALLRIFGWVPTGKEYGLKPTLEKDNAQSLDGSYLELYKSLRPGEMASLDNAKSLIDNMFFNDERYDLGQVGRFVFNRRIKRLKKQSPSFKKNIKNAKPGQKRLLSKEDLILVLMGILDRQQDPSVKSGDDIDHLGNRRVRPVGELIQNRFRLGLMRMSRNIRDRMSTANIEEIGLNKLINARPLIAAIEQFFSSSRLSQFMDQVNPLAELEHKRRLSAIGPGGLSRERAGFEVRDVHLSHYGRICPIQSSEGANIGLITYLSAYARLNKYGFLQTPYVKVKNGKPTNEVVYLDAFEEEDHIIASWDVFKGDSKLKAQKPKIKKQKLSPNKFVPARVKGEPGEIPLKKVDFVDIAPYQIISIATCLIPFLGHDDGQRALMGSNMQRQAVPCLIPDSPIVGTGMEKKAAKDSGQVVTAQESGKVVEVDGSHITIKPKNKEPVKYNLHSFLRSNTDTCLNQRPIVDKGQKVKKGQIIADGTSIDNGELALGENVLVAFMPWEGWNYEDAIIISERLLKKNKFASIQIEEFDVDVRDTKLGPEQTTSDIPNVSQEKLSNLDAEGFIRLGAPVQGNDILVGKISPKGEKELTAEERLLRAIFGEKARDVKDSSLRLPHGKRGKVLEVQSFSRDKGDKLDSGVLEKIRVRVAQLRSIQVGDKLAGRHGNKGVIAAILPEEDMPYLPDGRSVDVILNPLGVVSRMNIGQILETHLGWACNELGFKIASPTLFGVSEEKIKQTLKKAGLPEDGRLKLRDGRTGGLFDHKSTVGYMYIMKLGHMVEDKMHMRSIGPYSLITQQPLGGKAQFGGQRFGEMEVWALEGYGAAYNLQEMLTIKSDDMIGRSKAYEAIIKGEEIEPPHLPASFHVLVKELKGLGLEVDLE